MSKFILMWMAVYFLFCFPSLKAQGEQKGEKKHQLTINGKALVYMPPASENAEGPSLMAGVGVKYDFTEHLSAELCGEWTSYKVPQGIKTLIPITASLIYNFLPSASPFQTYVGGGLGLYLSNIEGVNSSTFGYHVLIGLGWSPKGDFYLKCEAKYAIPDYKEPSAGGLSIGGGISGSMSTTF